MSKVKKLYMVSFKYDGEEFTRIIRETHPSSAKCRVKKEMRKHDMHLESKDMSCIKVAEL